MPQNDIPAPGFQLVSGKRSPPKGEQRYHVQFRNGYVCQWTYTAAQLVWIHAGHDWDVVAVKPEGGKAKPDKATWTPTSGGY